MLKSRLPHILLQVAASLAFASAATSALSITTTCTPFVDVSSSATYCQAAQWLAARSVTIGCTDSTHFCPNDPVTRASMALFLNRTAIAIAPTFLQATETFTLTSGGAVECATNALAITGYNRVLSGDAMFYLTKGSGSALASGRMVYSVDGGSTWVNMADFDTPLTAASGGYSAGNSVSSIHYVQPGASLVVGIQVAAFETTDVSGGCEIRARLENFNYGILQ